MCSNNAEIQKMLSPKQAGADELKHLIHKLRWMGLEQEAETVLAQLSRVSPTATILAGPHDTD